MRVCGMGLALLLGASLGCTSAQAPARGSTDFAAGKGGRPEQIEQLRDDLEKWTDALLDFRLRMYDASSVAGEYETPADARRTGDDDLLLEFVEAVDELYRCTGSVPPTPSLEAPSDAAVDDRAMLRVLYDRKVAPRLAEACRAYEMAAQTIVWGLTSRDAYFLRSGAERFDDAELLLRDAVLAATELADMTSAVLEP